MSSYHQYMNMYLLIMITLLKILNVSSLPRAKNALHSPSNNYGDSRAEEYWRCLVKILLAIWIAIYWLVKDLVSFEGLAMPFWRVWWRFVADHVRYDPRQPYS